MHGTEGDRTANLSMAGTKNRLGQKTFDWAARLVLAAGELKFSTFTSSLGGKLRA